MELSDRDAFYQWLLTLSDDFLTFGGDYILFQSSSSFSDNDVNQAIDKLLLEFASFERSKEGKL